MRDIYNFKNLSLGKLVTTTSSNYKIFNSGFCAGPYIFNKNESGNYEEVFSDSEYDLMDPLFSKSGKTYVEGIDNSKLYNSLTNSEVIELEQTGQLYLNKKRVIEIYGVIRDQITIEREKQKEMEEFLEKRYLKKHTNRR